MPAAQEFASKLIVQVAHLMFKNSSFMHPSFTVTTPQPLYPVIPEFTPRVRPDPEPAPEEEISAEESTPAQPFKGPGCIAGEQTVQVHGLLQRLAKGDGGFGILRDGLERLEQAADGAERFGAPVLAAQIRLVAEKLPDVRTPEGAATLARELDPLVDEAWAVAIKCGQVNKGFVARAIEMSDKVLAGEIPEDEAAAILRNELE